MRSFLIGLLFLWCGALSAAEIFVSTTGNDTTGTGAIGAPFATLARGQTAAVAGDTITFRAGTYTGGGYFTKDDITYQSYTGEWAIIQYPTTVSGQDNTFYLGTAANCTVRRLEMVGGYFYAIKIDTGPCLIEDCIIHGSGRDCVKIPGADYVTIRRCEIYDSGLRDASNAEGIDNVNGDRMVVQDCWIHDIATNGLYPKGGSTASVIERNLIQRCGQKGISMSQSSGLAFYDPVANPGYYSCIDCIARNNIIEDCEGSGIDLESALRAHVYNNTMVNVAKSAQGGIRIASADKGGTVGVVTCRDCTIRNNIIVLGSASARPMLFMGANSHQGTLTMSGNRYYKTGGAAVFWWEPTGSYNLTLAGWKTASATDTNSTEGDPLLDASWHLNAGSPCIDATTVPPGLVSFLIYNDDYDGNARSGAWDIGADESGGTALATPPPGGTIGTGGGQGAPGAPNGPTSLYMAPIGAQVNLTWNDNSNNETGFRIERRENSGAWGTVGNVGADVNSWSQTSPGSAGYYEYRVIAYNASGDSTPSNSVSRMVSQVQPSSGGQTYDCSTGGNQTQAWYWVGAMLTLLAWRVRRRVV